MGCVHDLSVAPRSPAAPASAAARPEQRDDRQSGDEREARVFAHPAVCILGRCLDLDCAPPASGPDRRICRGGGSRCEWRRPDVRWHGGWCGIRSTARHGSHPARAREWAGTECRQRGRLYVLEGRQPAGVDDRRAGQGRQRRAAPRHDARNSCRARQRQCQLRTSRVDRKRRWAVGVEGDRRSRAARQTLRRPRLHRVWRRHTTEGRLRSGHRQELSDRHVHQPEP